MNAAPSSLISVIMPVYNHATYVLGAACSVLAQADVEVELIAIDDASTDASWEVLSTLEDKRIRLFRHTSNLGAHASLNEGLALAQGEWIAIINSDDLFHPERLSRCLAEMRDHQLDLLGTDIRLIDGEGKTLAAHWWVDAFNVLKKRRHESHDWVSALLYGNVFMTTSNFVMRRSMVEQIGAFSADRYVHDYDYLLRALGAGLKLGWLDEPLLDYRLHESNTISSNPLAANRECAALLRRSLYGFASRLNENELGAQRLQALGEQWARMDRYVDETWASLQHHALVTKEQELLPLIHDRDRWIAERDKTIAQQNAWVAERDLWIAERDLSIMERNRWVAERDAWINERDAIIAAQHAHIGILETAQTEQRQQIERLTQENARISQALDAMSHSRSYRLARLLGWPVRRMRGMASKLTRVSLRNTLQQWKQRLSAPDLPAEAKLRRITSMQALEHTLNALPAEVRCVSFDVFDTLLARCIEPPAALQQRVCEKIAHKLGAPHTPESVWQARLEVENTLRLACAQQGGDHECHFEPLVNDWVIRLLGWPDEGLSAWIHDCERRLEHLALSAKPGMTELLQKLRARGLRILAVSDMYLGETHIQALLDDCGLGRLIDRLYVSAEYGVGKYSGRLHTHVLQTEGLQAHEIIHIGDNLAADMLAPLRLGIQGIFLDERSERLRRRHQSLSADMAQQGGIWRGRQFFEIVEQRLQLTPQYAAPASPFFQHYGRDILGPAFCGFTLGLVERLRDYRPDKIFFLARDGYLFRQLYTRWGELMGHEQDPLPEACYAYVSRRVVASAAIADGMSHAQAIVGLYNPKQHGLLSILKTYGLDVESFKVRAAAHGFTQIDEPLHNWHDPRLLAFLADADVQDKIRAFGQSARRDLEAYFSQLGLFDCARAAFVDIGWSGTIQKFLGEAFAQRADFPELRGYYFAFVGQMHAEFSAPNAIEGLLCDARRNNPCERIPGEFEELFEQGARALEATTLGYCRLDDGHVMPILKRDDVPDRQGEIHSNPHVEAMHRGALEHLEHFYAAHELTGYSFAELKPYLQGVLERAVVYPTREEVVHISQLVHTEDFGHDHTLDIGASTLRWRNILRLREFKHQLSVAPWRYAILSRLPTPLPTWLYRLLWLRKKT